MRPEYSAEPTTYDFLIPKTWSPAKRRWRSFISIVVFFGIYAAVLYAFDMQWPGLVIGWIPATGLSAFGYYHPLGLLEIAIEILGSF